MNLDDQLAELWAGGATLTETNSSLAKAAMSSPAGSIARAKAEIRDWAKAAEAEQA